jgi:hypothetical protein
MIAGRLDDGRFDSFDFLRADLLMAAAFLLMIVCEQAAGQSRDPAF